jgi:hypothetical protein
MPQAAFGREASGRTTRGGEDAKEPRNYARHECKRGSPCSLRLRPRWNGRRNNAISLVSSRWTTYPPALPLSSIQMQNQAPRCLNPELWTVGRLWSGVSSVGQESD